MGKSSSNEKEMELLSEEINQLIAKREVERALELIESLLSFAKECNSDYYIGKAYSDKGFLYYGLNDTKQALKFLEISYSFFKKSKKEFYKEIVLVSNSLGVLYGKVNDFKKALDVFLFSIQISDEFNLKNSSVYNNIAWIYVAQTNYQKGLEYYKLAIKIEEETAPNNKKKIINYLSNIASLYIRTNENEKAEEIYKKTFNYCKLNNEYELMILTLKGLGTLLHDKENYNNSETYLKRAIEISAKINYKVHLIDLYLFLSKVYSKTNRIELQLESILKAYNISIESYPTKELLVLEELHDYYFNSGNIIDAYETLKKIYLLNNKTIQKEKEDKILELQEKFETEQKDKLIKQEQAFNQTLQEKNRELAALNEDLAQFNYGVSHDLKEPIRLVRGRLSHMHTKSIHKLNEEEQSSLETSLAAAERMERMLEDLHKFSSLGSNFKNLQEVNLNEVMAIVQADLQERIRANQALIEVEKLPNLLGYKNMFVQLFQNLINNALKFRRLELAPHIKISYKTDEDWHIIHVQDNGVGIKKENQEQVFKLFKRLQETEAREGSGVGLSIVQKIVKKMQGEISLASVYGTGTCFILKFPKK